MFKHVRNMIFFLKKNIWNLEINLLIIIQNLYTNQNNDWWNWKKNEFIYSNLEARINDGIASISIDCFYRSKHMKVSRIVDANEYDNWIWMFHVCFDCGRLIRMLLILYHFRNRKVVWVIRKNF